jgi:hypothetical protein
MPKNKEHVAPFVQLIDEIARLRGRLKVVFPDNAASIGLSELELFVLNAVTGAREPPTVPQIGRSLGHARQVIQRATNALVARGLIEIHRQP